MNRTVVHYEPADDGIGRIVLDGPDRLNAFAPETFADLADTVAAVRRDPTCRVVLLEGCGRAFCAGLDLNRGIDLAGASPERFLAVQEQASAAVTSVCHLPIPVIALVRGPAFGAGFALAAAADIRYCTPDATFCAAFIRIGLTGADNGASWLLPHLVGLGHASEILLTGRTVGASEAERIGLVNRVVDPDGLADAGRETAALIAGNTPIGVALTKEALHHNLGQPLDAAVAFENRGQTLAAQSPEFADRIARFLKREDPTE